MKRMSVLVILGALVLFSSRLEAASRRVEVQEQAATTIVEQLGTDLVIEAEAPTSLHWSPSRGFHYGRNCCKRGGDGKGARVSAQRFAGIDAGSGRPVYVGSRGRF